MSGVVLPWRIEESKKIEVPFVSCPRGPSHEGEGGKAAATMGVAMAMVAQRQCGGLGERIVGVLMGLCTRQ